MLLLMMMLLLNVVRLMQGKKLSRSEMRLKVLLLWLLLVLVKEEGDRRDQR